MSWTICKSFAPCSRQITTPVPHHSVFLQAGCSSCRQPTASKDRHGFSVHWRQLKNKTLKITTKWTQTSTTKIWQTSHADQNQRDTTDLGNRVNKVDSLFVDCYQQHLWKSWLGRLLQQISTVSSWLHATHSLVITRLCGIIYIVQTSKHAVSELTFTSKKADPNVGHLYVSFKNSVFASLSDMPTLCLWWAAICYQQTQQQVTNPASQWYVILHITKPRLTPPSPPV